MEIERKFLIDKVPPHLENYPCHQIEQAYLCTNPVVRIRQYDDDHYLTYKGEGLMSREEYNLPLTREAYEHLRTKIDGRLITKKRYNIPLDAGESSIGKELMIELDVFDKPFSPLVLAEVEFTSKKDAVDFTPPSWFGEDVTMDTEYHNSAMSQRV